MLFTGHSGVGKSAVISNLISRLVDGGAWASLPISFSAQTSARRTQESIESKLDKRKKTLLGPPPGKRMVMFVDDVNMPTLETYGAAPPVELLRQFLDQGGFYDRQKLFWKAVSDVVEVAACGPPGGGRNPLTPRYVRHHTVMVMPQPSAEAMRRIFSSIVGGHLALNGQAEIVSLTKPIIESTVDLYQTVLRDLKPIPAKAHYTFNLRDVSKVVQGLLMVQAAHIPSADVLIRLWCHEVTRVFADRFIDDTDRSYFKGLVAEYCKLQFKQSWTTEDIFDGENKLIFADYTKPGTPREERKYELVADVSKLGPLFDSYLEPPKGLRANLKGTWATVTDKQWDGCSKPLEWRKLLFGVAFFHAVVQERRKFGPLGWNIRYEFNGTDLEMSMETLRMFLDEQEVIPWAALLYVTGQINYGGRVTDDWDRRNLMVALRRFYRPEVLEDGFPFAPAGTTAASTYYSIAEGGLQAVRDWVDGLPYDDPVTVFGLHPNAKITFERQETDKLLATVTAIQPRLGGGGDGLSEEETVVALAEKLKAEVPELLLEENAGAGTFALNEKGELNSLQIVLLAEMGRFNKLLRRVSGSLADLGKAIKGLITMSADLDAMYGAMLKNQVPLLWAKVSYPSLKPLSSWFKDLQERVRFMRGWLAAGVSGMTCYSLPAFFFPQGFMTGILQMHARRYSIPIDSLSFSYEIRTEETAAACAAPPEDGVYIDGFFLDGARWDREKRQLADSRPTVMYDTLPVIHFVPTPHFERSEKDYECPLYKTAVRAGVLSTTGQSTNFVVAVDMPTDRDPDYWVAMGTAMLCALAS